MAPSIQPARRSMRWGLLALGFLSWASIGCSPSSLAMLLMPWNDNSVDPKYKLFSKDKEITLAIVAHSAYPVHPDHVAVGSELPEHVAQFFRKRCQERKHKIKIVPLAETQKHEQMLRAKGEYSAAELGKHFKADFVLELNIQACSLIEKDHIPRAFRGTADILVEMHKVKPSDDESPRFQEDLRFHFPNAPRPPVYEGTMNPAAFRRVFLTVMARDITKLFIAYGHEEKHPID